MVWRAFSLEKVLLMSPWEGCVGNADAHRHVVQLYDGRDARALTSSVGHYLHDGLKGGDSLLVIAANDHAKAFLQELANSGGEPGEAVRSGRLVCLDGHETLTKFMVDGQPEWDRFERTITKAIRDLRAGSEHGGLRAYGEMVGILWSDGAFSAAIRLEEFWNKLLPSIGFTLFCAYPIDVFNEEFKAPGVEALLCDHTHLLPTGVGEDLESAINRAMDDTLGTAAKNTKLLMEPMTRPAWAVLPKAEALILWIRNNLADEAEIILDRAREYYRASQQLRAYPS